MCSAVPALPPDGHSQGLRWWEPLIIQIAFGQKEKNIPGASWYHGRDVFLILVSLFSWELEPFVFLCFRSFKQCRARCPQPSSVPLDTKVSLLSDFEGRLWESSWMCRDTAVGKREAEMLV